MTTRRFSSKAWIVVLLLVVAVPVQARKKKNKKSGTASPSQASTAPVPDTYVIAPEDELEIDVWKEPEISRKVPVRPDGKISIALLNDVQAAGLTATELAGHIEEGLKKFITNPQVTVIVTTVNSQRVYILGEVNHPGVLPLLPNMTVLEAISTAGGFTQYANTKGVYVLRHEGGKQVKFEFNYRQVVKGQDIAQNIALIPGDQIIVP
jgi:polysaccharide biosynthesis/export protein